MRKILTAEEKEKKDKRNRLLIGIVLVALMVFSTAGYAFLNNEKTNTGSTSSSLDYKGIKFEKDYNDYWNAVIGNQQYSFRFNPQETENISVKVNTSLADYSNKPLYFSGNLSDAKYEIIRNLNSLVLRIQDACIGSQNCSGDLPVKDCRFDNVIILQEIKPEGVLGEDHCIFIDSNVQNQTAYADAFLFRVLGL